MKSQDILVYARSPFLKKNVGVPIVAQQLKNTTSIREDAGSTSGLIQSGVATSCGIGHRCGSDLALLWLWCSMQHTSDTFSTVLIIKKYSTSH